MLTNTIERVVSSVLFCLAMIGRALCLCGVHVWPEIPNGDLPAKRVCTHCMTRRYLL